MVSTTVHAWRGAPCAPSEQRRVRPRGLPQAARGPLVTRFRTRGDSVVTVLELGGDEWDGEWRRRNRLGSDTAPRRVGPLGHGPRQRRSLHIRRGNEW